MNDYQRGWEAALDEIVRVLSYEIPEPKTTSADEMLQECFRRISALRSTSARPPEDK
jgi:hypothetical protein